MTRVGYARVSTKDQSLDPQLDALTAAGCVRIFNDKISGKLAERPGLTQALDYLRPGDELVITKLDRLARSLRHLIELADTLRSRNIDLEVLGQGIETRTPAGRMFFGILALIAEFERELIAERTRDGLQAARARGRRGGRPTKVTPAKLAAARELRAKGELTMGQIAAAVGVSRGTLYDHLGRSA